MADEDDTKYCSNCKRDIAAVNFVMHEVHCHRNIVLCEHCDEPVPRSELDSHFEEIHAPVTCDLCGQTVEKSALSDHKEDDCMKRMKQCCFCELEVAFDALQEHQDVCGSRTELCPNCSQYVMLKDQGRHDDSNCTYPAPRATNNQRTSGEEFFMALDQGRMRPHADEWQDTWVSNPFRNATGADLSQRSMNRSKRAPTNAERSQVNARGRGRARGVSQISRLSSSGALRQLTRVLHANSVPPAPVGNTELRHDVSEVLDGNGELQHDVPRAVDTNEFRDDVRRDPVVSGELQRDVTEAPEPLMNNNMQYLTNSLAQDLRSPNNFTSLTSDLQSVTSNTWPAVSTESIASEDLTGLPCEFCGESFPADSLLLHQGICSSTVRELPSPPANIPSEVGSNWELSSLPLNPQFSAHDNYMSSLLGNNVLPSGDSAVSHRPSLFHFEDNLDHSTESRRLLHDLSRDMSPDLDDPTLMLPCEFCDALIPEDVLIQHQATCTAGGLESPQPTTSSWQLQRSQAVSETHPQQPRHQPDPVMVDVHRHRKPETGNYRNNWKKKNGPNQKNSGVWGANERNDIPPVDPRWRGPKHLGKCFLPPSVRDVMPKLAPAARNVVGNRATPRNTGTDPGASRRRQGGAAAAASDSLNHVVTEDAAIAVPMSPSVSPADDLENSDTTFVKSVDNDETEGVERRRELGRERRRERGHEPSSLLREVNATPSYEASFASDQTGRARGRRTGGGLPNSQKPAKSGNREGGAPSGGRGRNRNRKGGNQGSRRMPQGDV